MIKKIALISKLEHDLEVEMSILWILIKWLPEILVAYLVIKFIKEIVAIFKK